MDFKNVEYIHNDILFSHKNNGVLSLAAKWMKLKDVMLSEIRCKKTNPMCSL
jgi:hypothetical protein